MASGVFGISDSWNGVFLAYVENLGGRWLAIVVAFYIMTGGGSEVYILPS